MLDFFCNALYYAGVFIDNFQLLRSLTKLEKAIVGVGLVLLILVGFTQYRAITHIQKLNRAEKELQLLKNAVMSYWQSHQLVFPKDVHRSLASVFPSAVQGSVNDPWMTDSENATYGFEKKMDPTVGEYFILYTQGPKKDTRPTYNPISQVVEYSGSGIVLSNLPVKKMN